MVDEDEEEEEVEEKGNQEERIKKKKKKRKERELELDEEDYELLQENVTGFHRPTLKVRLMVQHGAFLQGSCLVPA
eukprot:jgi/Mesen1/7782/ME000408S06898